MVKKSLSTDPEDFVISNLNNYNYIQKSRLKRGMRAKIIKSGVRKSKVKSINFDSDQVIGKRNFTKFRVNDSVNYNNVNVGLGSLGGNNYNDGGYGNNYDNNNNFLSRSISSQDLYSTAPKPMKSSFFVRYRKIFLLCFVFVLLYFYWDDVLRLLLRLISSNDFTYAIYLSVVYEIQNYTLKGLLYASFFGSLFFMTIPVEYIFFYYLSLNYGPFELIFVSLIGSTLGLLFNFLVGYLIGPNLLKRFLKRKFVSFEKKFNKSGSKLILFGNVIPFPIEFTSLIIGSLRYSLFKFLFFTLIGRLIKFVVIVFGYNLFADELSLIWLDYFKPWIYYMFKSYIEPLLNLFN